MIPQRFFYLKQGGRVYGPFAAAQLLQKYRAGMIVEGDQISPDKNSWSDAIAFFTGAKEDSDDVQIQLIKPELQNSVRIESSGHQSSISKAVFEKEDEHTRFKATPHMFLQIVSILFLLVLLGGNILYVCQNGFAFIHILIPSEQNQKETAVTSDKDWQTIVQENKNAVGVVLFEIHSADGQNFLSPGGTAWAYSEHSFVTNTHVIATCYNALKNQNLRDVKVYVAINGSTLRHEIHSIQIHPDYLVGSTSDSDFAVLHTNDRLSSVLCCADREELLNVRQGDEIAFLGFPMEGLHGDNLNINNPIATMQKGNITSISDVKYGDSGFEKNVLIRHSLPTVGGASGSPIFSTRGNVIAILFAGNMNFEFKEDGVTLKKREASAAMINFAIRIDRLKPCLSAPQIAVQDFIRGK